MVPQRAPAMPSWGPPDGPKWCSHQWWEQHFTNFGELTILIRQKCCSHHWWEQHFTNFSELSILLRQDLDFNKMLLLPSVGTTFCEFPVDRNPV